MNPHVGRGTYGARCAPGGAHIVHAAEKRWVMPTQVPAAHSARIYEAPGFVGRGRTGRAVHPEQAAAEAVRHATAVQ